MQTPSQYEHVATVVSIVPVAIRENKPGLRPPTYEIPAAQKGEFQLLHIADATYAYYIDVHRGAITLAEPCESVARAVVEDYLRASIFRTDDAFPGLFWVRGKATKEIIKTVYNKELKGVQEAQDRWCNILMRYADDSWRLHRRHNVITDTQRAIAQYLGLKREWTEEIDPTMNTDCRFCRSVISTLAVVCPQCRMVLNPEALKGQQQVAV